MAIGPKDIPHLTGMDHYQFWKTSITAAFFILGLSSVINPRASAPAPTSNFPPDPLPCLSLVPLPTASNLLSEAENQAFALLAARKREWATARHAEQAAQAKETASRKAEEKKRDEAALGWMFLTMEAMLAQDVLGWLSKKRNNEGTPRKAELKEFIARMVWEKLAEKLDPDRQRLGLRRSEIGSWTLDGAISLFWELRILLGMDCISFFGGFLGMLGVVW
jgi:hypothetical protein